MASVRGAPLTVDHFIRQMKSEGSLWSERLEEALRSVPRQMFIDERIADHAYEDRPWGLMGDGDVVLEETSISAPSVTAKMIGWLNPQSGDRVLEIGTGSGYSTAVIEELVKPGNVYSLEINEDVARLAKKNLRRVGASAEVIVGDGSVGYLEKAPYNRIIAWAAMPSFPKILEEQLKRPGTAVMPIRAEVLPNGKTREEGYVFWNRWGELISRKIGDYVFVPMRGKNGFKEFPKSQV